jgi:hypothetical protein
MTKDVSDLSRFLPECESADAFYSPTDPAVGTAGSPRAWEGDRQLAPPAQGPTPPIRSMEYRTMYPV